MEYKNKKYAYKNKKYAQQNLSIRHNGKNNEIYITMTVLLLVKQYNRTQQVYCQHHHATHVESVRTITSLTRTATVLWYSR